MATLLVCHRFSRGGRRRRRRRGRGLAGGRRRGWSGGCRRRARWSGSRGRSPTGGRCQGRRESFGWYKRRVGGGWRVGGRRRGGWRVELFRRLKRSRRNIAGSRGRSLRDAARRTANGNKTGEVTRKGSQYDADKYRVERLAPTQRVEREVHQAGGSMISGIKNALKEACPR